MERDEGSMAEGEQAQSVSVKRRGQPQRQDLVAIEAPLTIRAAGRPWITVMRTPGHESELIAGLLRAEAICQNAQDLVGIEACTQLDDPEHDGHVFNVRLAPVALERLASQRRSTLSVSSCGLCGKEQIEACMTNFPPTASTPVRVHPTWIASLPGIMRGFQPLFDRTGAVHAAGVFSPGAKVPWVVREDVGRHNAVDKALGACFWPTSVHDARGAWLAVSGRVSFEIVQKAAMHGCVGIVAVSAPTSLAVQLAQAAKLTLVGFARGDDFVCYTESARIEAQP